MSGATPAVWTLIALQAPNLRAGLLAPGSTYYLRLPIPLRWNSGLVQGSSPVTAAGPRRLKPSSPLNPEGYPDNKIYKVNQGLSTLIGPPLLSMTIKLKS